MAQNYVAIAAESTYGTAPVSGYRGVKAADDGHKVNVLTMPSTGIVYGQHGPVSAGRRSIVRDAMGTIKADLASNGFGLLLRAAFGSAASTTPDGATLARQQLFETTGLASTYSVTTQVQRELTGGTADRDTYVGGQVAKMRLSQAVAPAGGGVSAEAKAKIEFDMVYQTIDTAVAQMLPTYVDPDIEFSVGECTLEVGPAGGSLSSQCLNKFDFELLTGLVPSPCISASFDQEKQTRGELPTATLGLAWDYAARTYYDAYLAGTIMQFRATWEPSGTAFEIESGTNPSIVLDIPAFQFSGDGPQMAESARTTQDLPGEVLWNGTDPMVSLTVITSDTAF